MSIFCERITVCKGGYAGSTWLVIMTPFGGIMGRLVRAWGSSPKPEQDQYRTQSPERDSRFPLLDNGNNLPPFL